MPPINGTPTSDTLTAPAGNSEINGFAGVDTLILNFRLLDATFSWVGTQLIIDTPSSHIVTTGFEVFSFTDGTVNNNDGNFLVDDLYYYSQNHGVWTAQGDADAAFANGGWQAGKNPNAFFNTKLYLMANPDVAAAGVNPLDHFHNSGWKEGRNPSFNFDDNLYLQANPDVAAAKIDPLLHFLAAGRDEGRQPFNTTTHLLGPNGFDYIYYLQQNPDVAAAGIDAYTHYATTGWKEGRNPNAFFDTKGYLATYTDVAAAGIDPLAHYATTGWKEGRNPSPAFDSSNYLDFYGDVKAANVNPLEHYLRFGEHEGRTAFNDSMTSTLGAIPEGAAVGTDTGLDVSWGLWLSPLLTFSLVGDTSGGGFALNAGVLEVADSTKLDFETSGLAHSYIVTIQASILGHTLTLPFSISIANVAPTTPTDTDADPNLVLEGAANGTLAQITVSSTDPNGPPVTYSLTNNAAGRFTIDPSTGVVTVNGTIDFEAIPGGTLQITAAATDGTATSTQTFTINIGNINEAPQGTDNAKNLQEDTPYTFTAADFGFSDPADNPTPNAFTGVLITGIAGAAGLTNNSIAVANGDFVSAADIAAGNLKFTPASNASGSNYASFAFQVRDDGATGGANVNTDPSANTMTIDVAAVNDTPSFTVGADQTVNEDAGAQTVVGFIGTFSPGPADEAGQAVNFIVSNDNGALFAPGGAPTIDAAGNLTYTPAANANGSATVTVQIHDNGGGADTSASQTFVINVNAVNDTPSFTVGANQTVNEDAGAQTVNGFIGTLSAGPSNESTQTVDFIVSNDNGALFAPGGEPTIDANGNLTYTPAANAHGTATVTVQIHDNGGGADTSVAQTFDITVNSVNDTPSFTVGADQTVNEDAGAQTVVGFIGTFSSGPANEAGQAVDFVVSNDNGALFAPGGAPTIDAAGNLTYTPAANANGSATVTVQIHDNGGGADTSASQTFVINVNAVNDTPSFTVGANQTANEDAGAQTVNGFIGTFSSGPSNESTQTVDFIVSNNNGALFAPGGEPTIDANGNLTYTPAANANGTATVTVQIHDTGGGTDTSVAQTFDITVSAVNDTPSFTVGADQTVNEDAGAQTVNGFIGTFSSGPANEAGQAVDFVVSNDNGALFAPGGEPTIDAAGNLSYTPAANANGSATVTVQIHDNGGGADTSASQTFVININAVNDAPTLTTADIDPSYPPGGAPPGGLPLFQNPTIVLVGPPDEAAQNIDQLVLTVGNVSGVATEESLIIDGTSIDLIDGGPTPTTNGTVTVSGVGGGTATVTLNLVPGLSASAMETLVNGITYTNTNVTPGELARAVTIVSLHDTAGATGTVNIISTVFFNQPPTIDVDGVVNYVENDPATLIDPTIAIVDNDNAAMAGATVKITTGFVSGEDVLTFTAGIGGISGIFAGDTLTLTGTGTKAEYEQVLESVRYQNTSNNPSGASRTIEFTVNDGSVNSAPDTAIINVAPVNDAPALTAGATLSYTENQAATAIDATVTVVDLDDTNIESATVQITGNYANGQDVLAFVNTATITGVFSAATGTLTLTGSDTLANYQAALRSVTYVNTSEAPSALARTVTFIANDGTNSSAGVTSTINVASVNDAPVLSDISGTVAYTENDPATIVDGAVTLTDADGPNLPAGATATVRITTNYQNGQDVLASPPNALFSASFNAALGTLTLTALAAVTTAQVEAALESVTYVNTSENPSGLTRTLEFQVNDGGAANNLSNIPTRTITVTPVNDAPVVTPNAGGAFTENGAAVDVAGSGALSDVDSANLAQVTVTLTNLQASDVLSMQTVAGTSGELLNGVDFTISGNVVTLTGGDNLAEYQSALQEVQFSSTSEAPSTVARAFTISANDGGAVNNVGSANVNVSVTAVNDAPVNNGVPASLTVHSNTPVKITGLSISDVDAGSGSNITTTLAAPEGTFAIGNGTSGGDAGIVGGATVTTNGSGTVVLTGTVAQINASLAGSNVAFTAKDDTGTGFDSTTTITVTTNDAGNSPAPALQDADIIQVGVLPQVWFINGDQTGVDANAPRGSQTNPFATVDEFNAAAVTATGPGPNDYIYVKAGTYSGQGINLENGQTLLGDDQALSFPNPYPPGNTIVIEDATGARPTISVAAANATDQGIDLASGNTIKGINIVTNAAGQSGVDDGNNGGGASDDAVGNLTIANVTVSGSGDAVDIDEGGGTFNVVFESLSSSGGAEGIQLGGAWTGTFTGGTGTLSGHSGSELDVNGGAGTFSYGGAINDGTGMAVQVANRTGGSVSLSGNITDAADDDVGINVTGNSGGATVTFSGQVALSTGTQAGVNLATNTGATINFTPAGNGLDIVTSTGTGFNATGGGTVNLTGSGNTISATGGIALNVVSTTIGASDLNFLSISANGGASGIVLNATGASGGLTVTGNGTNGSGGTSGGTITGTTGVGISLTNTRDVSLTNLGITNTGAEGIKTSSVTNFTYQDAAIVNAGDGNDENTIDLLNMFGTTLIEDVRLDDIQEDGIEIRQDADSDANLSTFDTITIRRLALEDHQAGFGEAGIEIQTNLASTLAVVVDDSDFAINTNAIMGVAMSKSATFTGHQKVTVQNSTFDGSAAFGSGAIQALGSIGSGTTTYLITGNTITNTQFDGIRVNNDGGHTNVTITNNDIDGSTAVGKVNNGEGITLRQDENGSMTVLISGNDMTQITSNQIHINGQDATIDDNVINVDATITNNTGTVAGAFGAGLLVDVGDGSGIAKNDVRINVTGNNLNGTNTAAFFDFDITLQLNETSGASLRVTQASNADLTAANGGSTVSSFANAPNTITYSAGTPPTPPLPLLAAAGGVESASGTPGDHDLTSPELAVMVTAAIGRWGAAGLTGEQLAQLRGLEFATADLGGSYLGLQDGGRILIDDDAAGYGWFVDTTPLDDGEFGHALSTTQLQTDPSGAPAGHMDLLTLVMHEIGHVLGLDHTHDASSGDLMSGTLVTGERRLPDASDTAGIRAPEIIGQNIVGAFDAEYYLAHNPDVAAAGVDPHFHFNLVGWQEGRDPNAFFDTEGYLAYYTDVAAAGVNPLQHYAEHGWREGRDPSAGFDTQMYLAANPDVAAANVNPLEHFLQYGIREGRAAVSDGLWG